MSDDIQTVQMTHGEAMEALWRREQVIKKLQKENEKLRAAMHDIYEVYAGSEGFIPQTCPEAYLQERVKEMADIAAKHKRAAAAALKETE